MNILDWLFGPKVEEPKCEEPQWKPNYDSAAHFAPDDPSTPPALQVEINKLRKRSTESQRVVKPYSVPTASGD